eukprot:gene13013-3517_t
MIAEECSMTGLEGGLNDTSEPILGTEPLVAQWEGRVKASLPDKNKHIIVIKIGTSSLLRSEHQTLNLSNLARICETVKKLHTQGHYVILVTSGAVGVGCQRLSLLEKPSQVEKKQALAAVGQVHLMKYYEDFMSALGLCCAQVLLTLDNLANRGQYINARNTFTELLAFGAIPVVNENDTVAVTQEHRFGDNDTLSAQVAALVPDISKLTADTSTEGTQWGTGGMATKLTAGRIAVAAGCTMVICCSAEPENVVKIIGGATEIGTKFWPLQNKLLGRKRWILSVPIRGQVSGDFSVQDAVSICDEQGEEFARGLANFSMEEVDRIKGKKNRKELSEILGYHAVGEMVHRENLALLANSEGQGYESEY